jgi:hypothetical protein
LKQSVSNLGAEVLETIQQCDDSDTLGALRAIRDECSEADFLAQVGDPILTSVILLRAVHQLSLSPPLFLPVVECHAVSVGRWR